MRTLLIALSLILTFSTTSAFSQVTPEEEFKGKPSSADLNFGALAGMGILDSSAGFNLVGAIAKKIVNRGFISDLNDQVFVEIELGPLFVSGSTAWFYSTHVRWDFKRDSEWTFYALGGLAGHVTSQALGDRWTALPRFGVGTFWKVAPMVTLRGELSHELIGVGVSYSL